MLTKINAAYTAGVQQALSLYKVAAGAMGIGNMGAATQSNGTATHQQNMASIPMAPPMMPSATTGASTAFTGGKPFAPITQTPGVKPAS